MELNLVKKIGLETNLRSNSEIMAKENRLLSLEGKLQQLIHGTPLATILLTTKELQRIYKDKKISKDLDLLVN